jgi:Mg2+-importing ATPase
VIRTDAARKHDMMSTGAARGRRLDKAAAAHMTTQQMLAALHASDQGLSPSEVTARRETYGTNALPKERNSALRILGRQFKSGGAPWCRQPGTQMA